MEVKNNWFIFTTVESLRTFVNPYQLFFWIYSMATLVGDFDLQRWREFEKFSKWSTKRLSKGFNIRDKVQMMYAKDERANTCGTSRYCY